ncbi:MAG: RNA methyltransferase [Myxococcales bacterium]|nr:RNA methyltransferase [Myxococcales bacterium]MCB9734780.1 RNA methyltransferase [Deltaproteobacteria bacterium]
MTRHDDWRGAAAQLARAGTARGRAHLGCCAIEGYRLFERALAAGHAPTSVIVSQRLVDAPTERAMAILRTLAERDVDAFIAPDEALDVLTEGRTFGDIVGLVPLPPPLDLEAACAGARATGVALLVACEVLEPGNVGALVRTALAGGAAGFVALGGADPFHPKAVRTSMGAVFRLPIGRVPLAEAATLYATCARHGVGLVGLATGDRPPLWEAPALCPRAAVLMGSEAFGLSDGQLAACDAVVTIPMPDHVDSYSVNAAAAVALFEWQRAAAVGAR